MNVNQCVMAGRLTNDAESTTTAKGNAMSKFRMAINDRYSDKTLFLNVLCFGKLSENLATRLVKGRVVVVNGKLQVEEFDRKDGSKGTSVTIMANDIELGTDPSLIIPREEKKESVPI